MKLWKTFVLLMLLLVVLVTVTACGKKEGDKVLRVGTNAEYPPFEYKSNNQFTGVDMDLARMIARRMGMKLEIVDMDFDALIPSLTANKIDMAISAITINGDRVKQVDFSIPYYNAQQSIIAKNESKITVSKAEDLGKYKIGVQNGTTGQIYLDENLVKKDLMDKKNLKKYQTNIEAITDLLNGNIDLVMIDNTAAIGYAALKPIRTIFSIDTKEQYGVALQKGSTYKDKLDSILKEIIAADSVNILVQTHSKNTQP